jgi:hypothetical protein
MDKPEHTFGPLIAAFRGQSGEPGFMSGYLVLQILPATAE